MKDACCKQLAAELRRLGDAFPDDPEWVELADEVEAQGLHSSPVNAAPNPSPPPLRVAAASSPAPLGQYADRLRFLLDRM